jgi:hypothetical protein
MPSKIDVKALCAEVVQALKEMHQDDRDKMVTEPVFQELRKMVPPPRKVGPGAPKDDMVKLNLSNALNQIRTSLELDSKGKNAKTFQRVFNAFMVILDIIVKERDNLHDLYLKLREVSEDKKGKLKLPLGCFMRGWTFYAPARNGLDHFKEFIKEGKWEQLAYGMIHLYAKDILNIEVRKEITALVKGSSAKWPYALIHEFLLQDGSARFAEHMKIMDGIDSECLDELMRYKPEGSAFNDLFDKPQEEKTKEYLVNLEGHKDDLTVALKAAVKVLEAHPKLVGNPHVERVKSYVEHQLGITFDN